MIRLLLICTLVFSFLLSDSASANENQSTQNVYQQRMALYVQYENLLVPWYFLAAVDQYERNIQGVRKDIPKKESTVAIQFSPEYWAGPFNPFYEDTAPETIGYFGGFGLDGDGDGIANAQDDEDVLHTMATYLSKYGPTEDHFETALWEYYKSENVVKQVLTIAALYKKFNTIELDRHAFPVSVNYTYSYRSTWGANRGWGGRRIHEGTDIFAGYGTPVLSASYGIIEVLGWNKFGGWRIGIRDNHNTYHYYAHLAYFNKGIAVGDIVEPGTLIGFVGSSGYGKEGTSGKFPPHLHYGMYKFNGRTEWAFDPYPSLRSSEREAKRKK